MAEPEAEADTAMAARLAAQFDGDGRRAVGGGGTAGDLTDIRLARLEACVGGLYKDVNLMRQRLCSSEENPRAIAAPTAGSLLEKLQGQVAHLESGMQEFAEELSTLRDMCLPKLIGDLEELRLRMAADRCAAERSVHDDHASVGHTRLPENPVGKSDPQNESTVSSVWADRTGNPDMVAMRLDHFEVSILARLGKFETSTVAAARADQLESKLVARIEEVESKIEKAPAGAPLDMALAHPQLQSFAKELEWMTWRVSYLEWSNNGGEKRGFSRPVEVGRPSPLLRPQSAAAITSAPTEDAELWVRTPNGRQRLRRQLLQLPVSSPGSTAVEALRGAPTGPEIQCQTMKKARSAGSVGRAKGAK